MKTAHMLAVRKTSAVVAAITLTLAMCGVPLTSAASAVAQGTVKYPNGTGAPNVQVQLHTPDGNFSKDAFTDSNGAYLFSETLNAGTNYTVEFSAPSGYARSADGQQCDFIYQTGDAARTCDFTMVSAPKTVSGRVTDANGNPVANAEIDLFPALRGGRESTNTDSNGYYAKQLRPGTWFANAAANLSDQNVHWINEHTPVKIAFTDDETVESAQQDFVVTPATGNLKVILLDSDGSKLTSHDFVADIAVYRADGIGTMRKVNSADSGLNIWLTPGIYSIAAYHPALTGKSFDPRATTFVMTDKGTVDLGTVTAQINSGHLKGTVVSTKGRRLPNVILQAVREGGAERISAMTDQNGSFDLTVGGGTWTIGLNAQFGVSQYSQLAPATATVSNGQTASGLTITISVIDRSVTGNVLTPSGLIATDFLGSTYIRSTSNAGRISTPVVNGAFTFNYSSEELTGNKIILGVQSDPGSPYAGGNEVTLKGSAVQNITLRSLDAMLTGTLKLEGGGIVTEPGSDIHISAVDSDGNFANTLVNIDGTYRLNLAAGTWLTDYDIVSPENTNGLINRPAGQTPVTLKANETVHKDLIVLQGANRITGTVTDANGNPVQRAHVIIDNRPTLDKNGSTNPNSIVSLTAETDETGVYGAYVPNGTYLVTVGDTPAVADTQLVPDGKTVSVKYSTVATVNLAFETSSATIKGTVKLNNKTEGGGTITGYSNDGKQVTAPVGSDGKFTLSVSKGQKWNFVATDIKGVNLLASDTKTVTPKSGINTVNIAVTDTGIDVPGPVTKSFSADEGGAVGLPNGMTASVPPFALDTTGTVTMTITPTVDLDPTSLDRPASLAYDIKATDSQSREVRKLNREMTVSVPYEQKAVEQNGLNEKNLSPKFFNQDTQVWETSGVNGLVDRTDNVATFSTTHLSKFSVTGTARTAPKATSVQSVQQTKTAMIVRISGNGFTNKASALLGTVKSKKAQVGKGGKTLTIIFPKKHYTNGKYNLVITNGDGRTITKEKALIVKGSAMTIHF